MTFRQPIGKREASTNDTAVVLFSDLSLERASDPRRTTTDPSIHCLSVLNIWSGERSIKQGVEVGRSKGGAMLTLSRVEYTKTP
jgi:hypothetical protein